MSLKKAHEHGDPKKIYMNIPYTQLTLKKIHINMPHTQVTPKKSAPLKKLVTLHINRVDHILHPTKTLVTLKNMDDPK